MLKKSWQLQDFHWINSPDNVTWRMHEGEFTLPEEGKRATGSIRTHWCCQDAQGLFGNHATCMWAMHAMNSATAWLMGRTLCFRLQHVRSS